MPTQAEEPGPVDLPVGKLISVRWKIIEKLGAGGCGAVYLVEDTKTKSRAALKAESNFAEGGAVLKLEVQVLKRLKGRQFMAQLISAGHKERYSYMVMTLFGPPLTKIFKDCNREFSVVTQVRIGMQILFGVKQLHEVGFIHRDIKPANLAIGLKGSERRMVHLLDFGLARQFVLRIDGKAEMRRPRVNPLFRGTYKYCSWNVHNRSEQGRQDDLWSMLYVLAELRGPLPWHHESDKKEIARIKNETSDEKLLQRSPPDLIKIASHLRELDYYKRPNYQLLFDILYDTMKKHKGSYTDNFDWEQTKSKTKSPSTFRRRLSRILTISEDKSVDLKTMENPETQMMTAQEHNSDRTLPFCDNDFTKNELGF